MKATGIVRRIDDLGRILIPKDVRKIIFGTQYADGQPMEFFIEGDSIVLKKHIENSYDIDIAEKAAEWNNTSTKKVPYEFIEWLSEQMRGGGAS